MSMLPVMQNWNKRVLKERASDFGAGENLRAAIYFQGRGSLMGQVIFGMVSKGGQASVPERVIAERMASAAGAQEREGYNTFEGSIAARFPDDKGVIAVTDQQLMVFGYSQGVFKTKITDPVASVPFLDLTGWSYRTGKVSSVLDMQFSDGSSVGLELPRANKPDEFAATLGIPATP